MGRDESSTDVRDHKYKLPSAIEVKMVPEELILRNNSQIVASDQMQVINLETFIEHSKSRNVFMEDDDIITYEAD